jgi:hypothetical protein
VNDLDTICSDVMDSLKFDESSLDYSILELQPCGGRRGSPLEGWKVEMQVAGRSRCAGMKILCRCGF